jgi:hypothetical protein
MMIACLSNAQDDDRMPTAGRDHKMMIACLSRSQDDDSVSVKLTR